MEVRDAVRDVDTRVRRRRRVVALCISRAEERKTTQARTAVPTAVRTRTRALAQSLDLGVEQKQKRTTRGRQSQSPRAAVFVENAALRKKVRAMEGLLAAAMRTRRAVGAESSSVADGVEAAEQHGVERAASCARWDASVVGSDAVAAAAGQVGGELLAGVARMEAVLEAMGGSESAATSSSSGSMPELGSGDGDGGGSTGLAQALEQFGFEVDGADDHGVSELESGSESGSGSTVELNVEAVEEAVGEAVRATSRLSAAPRTTVRALADVAPPFHDAILHVVGLINAARHYEAKARADDGARILTRGAAGEEAGGESEGDDIVDELLDIAEQIIVHGRTVARSSEEFAAYVSRMVIDLLPRARHLLLETV